MYTTKTLTIVTAVLGAPVAWQASDRAAPVEDVLVSAVPSEAAPGDSIRIVARGKRLRFCEARIKRTIIDYDGTLWSYPLAVIKNHERADPEEEFSLGLVLPPDLPEGLAEILVTTSFVCNWTHRLFPIVVVVPDIPVTITGVNDDAITDQS